jgi:hypothetical protein
MRFRSIVRQSAAVALVAVAAAGSLAAQTTYTWLGTEATQSPRLIRNGTPSNWQLAPKAFPGTFGSGTFLFTTFTYTNASAQARPFFVDMIGVSGDLTLANVFFAAYLNSFNPADLAQNYLGDAGRSCVVELCVGTDGDFSVLLGANQTLVLNVHRINSGNAAGGSFTFSAGFNDPNVVPEPSTYALMATGLAGLGAIARRRRMRA